ncbi:uncharacterized protein LOC114293443 [Camellia sinensis]|uniref:uncharacterized protein LOC114293443 n=1 Tax=Camellia sinensis TaxID=4442 RepID=UPI001036E243|nr:uncharacterized protein LOC114293443 [Camellia sinensis]
MMVDYSSNLHDLDTMGDKLVIEGTTTPKGSSYILKDSLTDSDLLILMDVAKRNGGKKHRSASNIEMRKSPKAFSRVESKIPSPSFLVDAMGGLYSEIQEMNFIQLHFKTTDKKCNKVSSSSYCCGFRCLNTYIRHPHPCDRSKWICHSCSWNCYKNCCR